MANDVLDVMAHWRRRIWCVKLVTKCFIFSASSVPSANDGLTPESRWKFTPFRNCYVVSRNQFYLNFLFLPRFRESFQACHCFWTKISWRSSYYHLLLPFTQFLLDLSFPKLWVTFFEDFLSCVQKSRLSTLCKIFYHLNLYSEGLLFPKFQVSLLRTDTSRVLRDFPEFPWMSPLPLCSPLRCSIKFNSTLCISLRIYIHSVTFSRSFPFDVSSVKSLRTNSFLEIK